MHTGQKLAWLALFGVALGVALLSGGSDAYFLASPRGLFIGMDILDTTPTNSFAQNITLARDAHANYILLGLGWNQIEASTPSDCTTAGSYVDPYSGVLASFNTLLPANNLTLSLGILPVSTSADSRPSNLQALAFDDPLVICRFQKVLEFVFAKIPNLTLVSLQIGNELDDFPAATTSAFWGQYWNLFVAGRAWARGLRPGVLVDVTGTVYGILGVSGNPLSMSGLQAINSQADMVGATYYPINADFTVKNVSVVSSDLNSLSSLYATSQIFLNEIGYPSGSTFVGSSPALQSQFIHNVMLALAAHHNISHGLFLRLNDLSLSVAQDRAVSYGFGGNNNFIEFIQTLGLYDYGGTVKPAYTQMLSDIATLGF